MLNQHTHIQGVSEKNDPTCFCQNFVKSPPNFMIFGVQIAETIEICQVHSLSTSPGLDNALPQWRIQGGGTEGGGHPLLTGCISKMVNILHKMHHFYLKFPKFFSGGGKAPYSQVLDLPLHYHVKRRCSNCYIMR